MKLTIKCLDSSPIGALASTRCAAVYEFKEVGADPFCSYKVENGSLVLDEREALILKDASYTPGNQILSIILAHREEKEEKNVFAAIFEFKNVPSYCAFPLPSGRFVELRVEFELSQGVSH